jgi:hypothetical protein
MAVRADEADPRVMLYRRLLKAGTECEHGQPAGSIIRPWCLTPACPRCRREASYLWVTVEAAATIGAPNPPGQGGL